MTLRPRVPLLAPLVIAMVASVARADAPATQYSLFDSFTPTIADARTGLMWQRAVNVQQLPFLSAAQN